MFCLLPIGHGSLGTPLCDHVAAGTVYGGKNLKSITNNAPKEDGSEETLAPQIINQMLAQI